MDKHFLVNDQLSALDIQDAIDERIAKAQSILVALTADGITEELQDKDINNILWAIRSYIEEIKELHDRLGDIYQETIAAKSLVGALEAD